MRYESLKDLSEEEFRRLTGVKPSTFNHMVEILEISYKNKRWHGGRSSKLSVEDQLLITLEYRAYFHIGNSYGISESSAYKAIKWVEDTLIKHPDFALPGKKALINSDIACEIVLMDVSESPIQRPKKAKRYYSGKKKRHTLKAQIAVDRTQQKIICTSFGKGKKHDFRLFKESKVPIHSETKTFEDSGYQGIQKIHANSEIPKKKTRKNPLTKQDKKKNRELSRIRVLVENVIALIKGFKIIADKYRNRQKRFGLRFNLIAAICNWENN